MKECFNTVATRQVAELGSTTWQVDDLRPHFFISSVTANGTYVRCVK